MSAGHRKPTGPESIREQQHNKPLEIKDQEMFDKTVEYVHLSPVMVGFLTKPEDWKHSSARDFAGLKGLIKFLVRDYNGTGGRSYHCIMI